MRCSGAFDRPGGVVLPPPIPLHAPRTAAGDPDSLRTARRSVHRPERASLFGADPRPRSLAGMGGRPAPRGARPRRIQSGVRQPGRERQAARRAGAHPDGRCASARSSIETAAPRRLRPPDPVFSRELASSTTPPGRRFQRRSAWPARDRAARSTRATRATCCWSWPQANRGGDRQRRCPGASYEDYLRDRLEGLVSLRAGSRHLRLLRGVLGPLPRRARLAIPGATATRGVLGGPDARRGLVEPGADARQDWQRLFATASGRYEFFSLALEHRLQELGGGRAVGRQDGDAAAASAEKLGLEADGRRGLPAPLRAAAVERRGRADPGAVPSRSPAAAAWASPRRWCWRCSATRCCSPAGGPGELAPETAHELHLEEGDLVALESERGSIEASCASSRDRHRASPMCRSAWVMKRWRGRLGGRREPGRHLLPARSAVRRPGPDLDPGACAASAWRGVKHGGQRPLDGGHG